MYGNRPSGDAHAFRSGPAVWQSSPRIGYVASGRGAVGVFVLQQQPRDGFSGRLGGAADWLPARLLRHDLDAKDLHAAESSGAADRALGSASGCIGGSGAAYSAAPADL